MNVQDSETGFLVLMIISEVVVTAVAFIGAYYIFKPFFRPKDKKEDKTINDEKVDSN